MGAWMVGFLEVWKISILGACYKLTKDLSGKLAEGPK